MEQAQVIHIRPESGILAVLSHLNYKPWFALAEFVDNSIQSYLNDRRRIEEVDGSDQQLHVLIRLDSSIGRITIRDNAGGIAWGDFPRAFKAAQLPPDRRGLSEFGLGMKTAACWFSRKWSVRTTALGENVERTVVFDVDEIQRTDQETITVISSPVKSQLHYTEVQLDLLNHPVPHRNTLRKVRDHLRDIYRCFTRDGMLRLCLETDLTGVEDLVYEDRKVLIAPPYGRNNEPSSDQAILWRKDVNVEFGNGYRAKGFAGILETADTTRAGFALFRRRRLIMGSDDETYRPAEVFGRPNDFAYQRVFGELHIEGLQVAGTKDGFRWGGFEEDFLQSLRAQLDSLPVPLLRQANNYRSRPRKNSPEEVELQEDLAVVVKSVVEAARSTAAELSRQARPDIVPQFEPDQLPPSQGSVLEREFRILVAGQTWTVTLEYTDDSSIGEFVEVAGRADSPVPRQLCHRLNLAHPFVQAFIGSTRENLELITFVAVAIALAERTTQAGGPDAQAARMRVNIGDVLRAMSHGRR